MQFAAALVEYLVSGVVALLWFLPLVSWAFGVTFSLSEQSLSLSLPIAYALGVLLDATAYALVDRWRDRESSLAPYQRTAQILIYSPEAVAKTLAAYAGRDRIARGLLVSAAFALITYGFTLPSSARAAALPGAAIVLVWSAWAWRHLDRHTSEFKEQVLKSLPRRAEG